MDAFAKLLGDSRGVTQKAVAQADLAAVRSLLWMVEAQGSLTFTLSGELDYDPVSDEDRTFRACVLIAENEPVAYVDSGRPGYLLLTAAESRARTDLEAVLERAAAVSQRELWREDPAMLEHIAEKLGWKPPKPADLTL